MRNNKRGITGRAFVALLALVLVFGCAVGGTLAWLTDVTDKVENTFTYGDINITLEETERSYKIVPGVDIDKDPKVTVQADSEACYLFVKVEEKDWPTFDENGARKVDYSIADGWSLLVGTDGVYYREVDATTADVEVPVLKDDKVTVSKNLTKTEIDEVKDTVPTLTFTAYAIQKEGFSDAAAAWAKVSE